MNVMNIRILPFIVLSLGACLVNAQALPRNKVRFLGQLTLAQLPPIESHPTSGSGCAGYVSPSGREYAIMGQSNGNSIIEITDPTNPRIVAHIPGRVSSWHEVCVLGNYAYATTEAGGGVQIIDLTQVDSNIVELANTLQVNGLSRGHTIQAVPSSNLIVVNGGDVNGLRVYDCKDPVNPVPVGSWTTKYVHDSFFKKFTSGTYAGKEICFAFCANGADGGVYIIDFTTTVNAQGLHIPKLEQLSFTRYFNQTNFYCHSGSLSPDGRTLLVNDELDEANGISANTTTLILDVTNLSAPVAKTPFVNPLKTIDHNSMIQDGFLMLSAYKEGLRVYDVGNPLSPKETGFFDTFNGDGFQFQGAWGTWAGFPSGNVIISDINAGFIVVDPSEAKMLGAPIISSTFENIPIPSGGNVKLRKPDNNPVDVDIPSGNGAIAVNFRTDSLVKGKVDFRVRAKSRSNQQETLRIYAISAVDGSQRQIATGTLKHNYSDILANNLSGAEYIGADNTIRLKVEILPGRKGAAAVDIDLMKATAH